MNNPNSDSPETISDLKKVSRSKGSLQIKSGILMTSDRPAKKIIDADDKGYSYKDGSFGDLNKMLKDTQKYNPISYP